MSGYKYLRPEFLQSVRDLKLSEVAPAAPCSRETIERLEASNDILTTLLHFPLAPTCEVSFAEIEACVSNNRMEIERLKNPRENV